MVVADAVILALDAMIADTATKYHQLLTGRLPVKIVVDGQETEFNKARAADLREYLEDLKAQREQLVTGAPTVGAIGIVF